MAKILLTGVNVLDCSGDNPFSGEVLVEENHKSSFGPRKAVKSSMRAARRTQAIDGLTRKLYRQRAGIRVHGKSRRHDIDNI